MSSTSPRWRRHTSNFEADSIRFLAIVQHFLAQYFDHSDDTAEQALDAFMAEAAWDEDMYHHEGAYRVAAVIHYVRDLSGDRSRAFEWLLESGHHRQPAAAREHFWRHYLL